MDAKSMNLENRKAEEVKKVLLYQILVFLAHRKR